MKEYTLKRKPTRKAGDETRRRAIVPPKPGKGERQPRPYSPADLDALWATAHRHDWQAIVTLNPPPTARITSWPPLRGTLEKLKVTLTNWRRREGFPACIAVTEFDPDQSHEGQIVANFHVGFLLPLTEDQRRKLCDYWLKLHSLAICVTSIYYESGPYSWGTPSLPWIVLLCMTWALIVALIPQVKMDIGRFFRLRRKREQRRWRREVASLLSKNYLNVTAFETMLNNGKQNSVVNLPPGCAQKGWRSMPTDHLMDAVKMLQSFLHDRTSSIRRLEKLIRKGTTSDKDLLDLARGKYPEITDWRNLNWGELKVFIALVTKDPRDYRNAIGH